MHCTAKTVLLPLTANPSVLRKSSTTVLPTFLAPSLLFHASFSTTSVACARKDGNPGRGVSALRRTGPSKRQALSVKLANLPKPILDPSRRSTVEVDPDHGLWQFFPPDKTTMATPEALHSHGRAWTVVELRYKDWDDLHRLWWVCLKEINRLNTYAVERDRVGNMYGGHEDGGRRKEVKLTMKAIRHTLTERWYTWENARIAAMQDEEIDMYADLDAGQKAYSPRNEQAQAADERGEVSENEYQPFQSIPPPPDRGSATRETVA